MFTARTTPTAICNALLGQMGRCISYSKLGYTRQYPHNLVVFNANVCTKNQKKIWYGDLDITKDREKLRELAGALGEDVYVLREMDARFDNQDNPQFEAAVAVFTKDGLMNV